MIEKYSQEFLKSIKIYLDNLSKGDLHFSLKYSDSKKSLEECLNYIIGQVQRMKVNVLTNNEVYQMARHYYLEEISDKECEEKKCKVVVTNEDFEKESLNFIDLEDFL